VAGRFPPSETLQQFLRFALIGGVATAIQYAVLIILVQAQVSGAVGASAIGFTLSALANYTLNRRFTFHSTRAHVEALPRFTAVALLGLAINTGLIWLFHVPLALHYLVAQVLATCGTLLWNYSLNRVWTFSGPSLPREAP
jgi:putative flippase GtrA